jgi:hypothetical protein
MHQQGGSYQYSARDKGLQSLVEGLLATDLVRPGSHMHHN